MENRIYGLKRATTTISNNAAKRLIPLGMYEFRGLELSNSGVPKTDGIVRVSRETKGRGGKTVTQVLGVPLDALAMAQLGKQLRAACGSGGTVNDGVIEVQGDHCDTVMAALQKKGYVVKRAGG